MKLSMEIPTAYLDEWSPLCDLDFALAHRVLEGGMYRDHYASRPTGRELILDNSMHEVGRPLSPIELMEAARQCRATTVIAPDMLGEPEKNYEWFKDTHRLLGNRYKIGVVMSGRDISERATFLENVRQADLLCLPYREPRFDWLTENMPVVERRWRNRVHLLGMSSVEELLRYRTFGIDTRGWSIDTRKPVKWGLQKIRMNLKQSLRGGHLNNRIDDMFEVRNLTCAQVETILWNVAYLRTFLS